MSRSTLICDAPSALWDLLLGISPLSAALFTLSVRLVSRARAADKGVSGSMEHRVKFVADELLVVAGRQLDWALCNVRADGITLCIRSGVRTMSDEDAESVLEAGWQAYRALCDERPQLLAV